MSDSSCTPRLVLALFGAALGLSAAAQPPEPPEPAPPGPEICLECHEAPEGRVVHAPVAEKECLLCHDPHASRHAALLQGSDLGLCTECHDDVGTRARNATHPHAALRGERACRRCHEAHAAERAALLREATPALCAACHAAVTARLGAASSHMPAAEGECASCHDPHGAVRAALLREERRAVCAECHDTAELKPRHHGFELAGADCTSCHDPHGSPGAHLVREKLHAPFEEEACDLCHEKPDSPRELSFPVVELCRECHDDKGTETPAEHWVGEGVACTSCHSPHAGLEPAVMRSHPRALCLDCHGEIRERIARGFSVHPIEAEEGRCTACHQLHGGAAAPLLKDTPDRMCATCHEQHARFTHPMGPNVPDPRDPSRTVDCLSCHDPHGSGERMLLRGSPERELCVACHEDLR